MTEPIPPALDTDAEDVVWALQTAASLWKRNERADAIVWLRRAAQAAGDAEDDDRALALAREAAELAERIADLLPADTTLESVPPVSDGSNADLEDLLAQSERSNAPAVGETVGEAVGEIVGETVGASGETVGDTFGATVGASAVASPVAAAVGSEPPRGRLATEPPADQTAENAAYRSDAVDGDAAGDAPPRTTDAPVPISITPDALLDADDEPDEPVVGLPPRLQIPPPPPAPPAPAANLGVAAPPVLPPLPSPPRTQVATPQPFAPAGRSPRTTPAPTFRARADSTPEDTGALEVPSAAEVHAGLLDPWAEPEPQMIVRGVRRKDDRPSLEPDEVITSAAPIGRTPSATTEAEKPARKPGAKPLPPPVPPPVRPAPTVQHASSTDANAADGVITSSPPLPPPPASMAAPSIAPPSMDPASVAPLLVPRSVPPMAPVLRPPRPGPIPNKAASIAPAPIAPAPLAPAPNVPAPIAPASLAPPSTAPTVSPPPPAPTLRVASPEPTAAVGGVVLANVPAFATLDETLRRTLATSATVEKRAHEEEVFDFTLALVLKGTFDVASPLVDAPALRVTTGDVLLGRGSLARTNAIRLIAVGDEGEVAVWDDAPCAAVFGIAKQAEASLREAADRIQALVGATFGPLGDRLDTGLRDQVTSRLSVRRLAPGERLAEQGKPVPGFCIVGAGEIELVTAAADGDGTPPGAPSVLRPGDFLFASEVLGGAKAPATASAGAGGALVLFADRMAAQELLVTVPPLLEILAGM
jgi:hypothetical protein